MFLDFHPRLASVKQSLLPKLLIFCSSIECLLYMKAKHSTCNLGYGFQICLNSAKLLIKLSECSISPLRSSG